MMIMVATFFECEFSLLCTEIMNSSSILYVSRPLYPTAAHISTPRSAMPPWKEQQRHCQEFLSHETDFMENHQAVADR